METEKSVGDERVKLTDGQIGTLYKRTTEIIRRATIGAISYEDAVNGMQDIIEGRSKRLKLGLIPEKKWWEEDGVVYFEVTSNGTTGEQWIVRLEKQGFKLAKRSKELLLSKDFKVTNGIVYTIAVLKGSLFICSNRITRKIRSEAAKRKLVTPNPEIACLIREMFSDDDIKAMDLVWIVTFHEPIKDSDGVLSLLFTYRHGDGSWLHACYGNSDGSWGGRGGFAFEVSQVSL